MVRAPRPIARAPTAFLSLFSIVGFALYGLPFFYDFFVRDLGWTRQQVTSGNAYSKLLIGPLFGFLAGWFIDRFGPRRLMLAGILMAGGALVGLGAVSTLALLLSLLPVQRARATSAAGRCRIRCCCRAGSTRTAARRWALPISASASAAPSSRCWRTR